MDLFVGSYNVVLVDKNSDKMAKLESASITKFNLGLINLIIKWYLSIINYHNKSS